VLAAALLVVAPQQLRVNRRELPLLAAYGAGGVVVLVGIVLAQTAR
jgi:hypothetical protein